MFIKYGSFVKGFFKGETIEDVALEDPEYLANLVNTKELTFEENSAIIEALDSVEYQFTLEKEI